MVRSRTLRQLIVLAAAAAIAVASLPAPAMASSTPPPARAIGAADAPPAGPPDADPTTATLEVDLKYFTEPDFLLQAGNQRWEVRNRPAGTVAAGFGHTTDAIHDDLTATARYAPLGTGPSLLLGTIGSNRQALDVSTLIPGELRTYSWKVTRFDDASVEFEGPIEKGSPTHVIIGPNVDSPTGYVGGTVISDQGGVSFLVVRANGTVAKAQLGASLTLTQIADVGGAAVAAVSRSVSALNGAPRFGTITGQAPGASTLLVVWRADGQFVPIRIGVGTNGITKLNALSTLNVNLNATSVFTPATFDFDWNCVTASQNAGLIPLLTGGIATYLGCPAGHDGAAGNDTISLGRISLGVPVRPATGPEVRVLTSADYANEQASGLIYSPNIETKVETGCSYASQAVATGIVPVGSFDIRTVMGVTHLACVEPLSASARISEYLQPKNQMALAVLGDPLGRGAEKNQVTRAFQRKTFDHHYEPGGPGSKPDGTVPIQTITYLSITQPTIQLQFPCAQLVTRPVREGLYLDDCDQPTNPLVIPNGVAAAAVPSNWISYTIAAYATTTVGTAQQRRLVVLNTPAGVPLDRTYTNATTPPDVTVANLSWVVEPSPYLASDLTRILSEPDVDPSAFDVYAVPNANQPRLLLAQFVRPEWTTVRVDLGTAGPELEASPTVPIAVLQAPPLAGGMGQDENFTAGFGQSTVSGQETERSGSTNIGTHVGIEATATVGVGALGNHARMGGGASAEFEFMNTVENSIVKSVETEVGGTYYGTFDDHTIVTRAIDQWVWHGNIIRDPTGLAVGEPATYSVPIAPEIKQLSLSYLAEHEPGLYGPEGIYGKSLQRIVGSSKIGDPDSYRRGADLLSGEPPSILAGNGGPCKGGYVGPNIKTPFNGDLPQMISPENPFYDQVPPVPTGPNIIVSPRFTSTVDEGLSSEADIVISEATTRSLLTSLSYDFSVSAIGKLEAENDTGESSSVDIAVTAGVDAGWGTSAGVSDTLGSSSELTATIAGIPFGGPEFAAWRAANPWVAKEGYSWRMFLCKAQLGPIALGHEVWVQGYVTDLYSGVGGLDALAPIDLTAPADDTLVRAAVTPGPAAGAATSCTGGPNEFSWTQSEGTLRRTSLVFEDTLTASRRTRTVKEWAEPKAFLSTVKRNAADTTQGLVARPGCAAVDPGVFVDGAFYKATVVTDGFLPDESGEGDDSVSSDFISLQAEVWPPSVTLDLPAPIVGPDGTAKIQIQHPEDVVSLTYHVAIRNVATQEVIEEGDSDDTYVTAPLPAGTYEASVVGFNDHKKAGGARAETPVAEAQFTFVPNELVAQWSYDCGHVPCTTDDTFQFTDESIAGTATITKWAWNFGDGTTSSQANPTHRFAAPSPEIGYTVRLKVTDSQGRIRSLEQDITVDESRLPNLTIGDVKFNEKNAPAKATFKIRLSKASDQPITVTWKTGDGTAVAGKDYAAASGSVTFAPGETLKTITVKVLQDRKVESTESYKVRLKADAALVNLIDLLGTGKIVDDD
jgi:PKD repeat protein